MTTPENLTKQAVVRLLTAYRDAGLPLRWTMFIPTAGSVGEPDFLCCVDGLYLGIECKAEKKDGGRAPTQRQLDVHTEIRDAGGTMFVVGEEAEFNELGLWLYRRQMLFCIRFLRTQPSNTPPTGQLAVPWRSEAVKTRRKPPPLRGST